MTSSPTSTWAEPGPSPSWLPLCRMCSFTNGESLRTLTAARTRAETPPGSPRTELHPEHLAARSSRAERPRSRSRVHAPRARRRRVQVASGAASAQASSRGSPVSQSPARAFPRLRLTRLWGAGLLPESSPLRGSNPPGEGGPTPLHGRAAVSQDQWG